MLEEKGLFYPTQAAFLWPVKNLALRSSGVPIYTVSVYFGYFLMFLQWIRARLSPKHQVKPKITELQMPGAALTAVPRAAVLVRWVGATWRPNLS